MKKNQIKIKNLKNGRVLYVTVKKDGIYNHFGKAIYCSCTGKTESTATKMLYDEKNRTVYCPNCREQKVEVLQTYAEYQQEEQERQAERLANLHLTLVGDDWECGQKYYALSTEIDYENWLKIKKYFSYHKKGWSRYRLFESAEEISEAEARSCHFNATFGWGTIETYSLKNNEIIHCRSAGDFVFGRKIKYSAEAENLLKRISQLEAEIKAINSGYDSYLRSILAI